jgi:hypothetical protein
VQAPKKERWLELCEMAAKEFDPTKLLELTSEIDRLLAEREPLKGKQTIAGYLA